MNVHIVPRNFHKMAICTDILEKIINKIICILTNKQKKEISKIRFFCLYSLQNLMPIKLGAQEFSCPICPKLSTKKEAMQKHILIHTGEKPFICPYCPQKFSQNGHMHRHIRNVHELIHFSK